MSHFVLTKYPNLNKNEVFLKLELVYLAAKSYYILILCHSSHQNQRLRSCFKLIRECLLKLCVWYNCAKPLFHHF